MVARRRERQDILPIGKNDIRELFALKCFLQQYAAARLPKLALLHQPFDKRRRLIRRSSHQHTLAGTQAIGLYRHWPVHCAQGAIGAAGRVMHAVHPSGRDAVAFCKLLGVDFTALEFSRQLRGPGYPQAAARELVRDTKH